MGGHGWVLEAWIRVVFQIVSPPQGGWISRLEYDQSLIERHLSKVQLPKKIAQMVNSKKGEVGNSMVAIIITPQRPSEFFQEQSGGDDFLLLCQQKGEGREQETGPEPE